MEEAGQGDFPARGCQMCDLAHHSATRATADSQLDASWNPRRCIQPAREKTMAEI